MLGHSNRINGASGTYELSDSRAVITARYTVVSVCVVRARRLLTHGGRANPARRLIADVMRLGHQNLTLTYTITTLHKWKDYDSPGNPRKASAICGSTVCHHRGRDGVLRRQRILLDDPGIPKARTVLFHSWSQRRFRILVVPTRSATRGRTISFIVLSPGKRPNEKSAQSRKQALMPMTEANTASARKRSW